MLTGGPAGGAAALAEAVALVERAAAELHAAGDVEWQARAADLYRAAVAEEAHALARERVLLDEAARAVAQVAAGLGELGQAPAARPYGRWVR